MSNRFNNLYEFGEFRLDAEERVLLRGDETIILASKVFDTLELLVSNHGKILTKNEIMNEVWTDSFVEESNLTQNIYLLRKTLGKDFIETIPRRGYKFKKDVKIISHSVKTEKALARNGSSDVLIAERTRTQIIEEEFLDDATDPTDIPGVNPQLDGTARTKNVYLLGGIGILTLFVMGFGGFWFWNNSANKTGPTFENSQIQRLTDTGDVAAVTISPNNRFAAYTIIDDDKKILRLKDLKVNEDVRLDVPSDINPLFLRFSVDGDHIYFLDRPAKDPFSKIHRITRFGGDNKIIANNVSSAFNFSKDGKKIAFYRKDPKTNESSLVVKNLETDEETIVLKKSFPDSFLIISSPAFSADGNKIYFLSEKDASHSSAISIVNLETSEESVVETPKWIKHFVQVETTPNEDELIVAARENGRLAQVLKLADGKATRITNDLNNYRRISVSSDGKSIAALQKTSTSNLYLYSEGDIEKPTQLTNSDFNRAGRHGLEIMPNGKILYVSLEKQNRDIWTLDINDKSKNQLTRHESDISQNPSVSPNGRHIYYVSSKDKSRHIKRMDLDGQNQIFVTSDKKFNDTFPAVSPDGDTLYFIRREKGNSSIMKMSLPDGQPEKFDVSGKVVPDGFLRISPDGRFIAFQQLEKRNAITVNNPKSMKVGIVSLEEKSPEPRFFQLKSNRQTFRWNKTSDGFDFVVNSPDISYIKRLKIGGDSEAETVFELKGKQIREFIWMQNNNDLLLADSINKSDGVLINNIDGKNNLD